MNSASLLRTLVMASALLVGACHRDGGVIGTATLPNIAGKFVIEDDNRTAALTSVQHSIYYVVGSDRRLVFRGAGGERPVLALLGPDDILVRYCGGTIYKVEVLRERSGQHAPLTLAAGDFARTNGEWPSHLPATQHLERVAAFHPNLPS
jgi:hypothetical protein